MKTLSLKEIPQELDDMDKLRIDLDKTDKERETKWNSHQEEMRLAYSFMYVSSFSRKSKFQADPNREVIAENLLYDLLANSIACATISGTDKIKDIPFSFWLTATVEGIELLLPFQRKISCVRHLRKSMDTLRGLRKRYYAGEYIEFGDDDVQALRTELDRAKRTLRG